MCVSKQEKTEAPREDDVELKTWNKHTKNHEDDTEVNSQSSTADWDFLIPASV